MALKIALAANAVTFLCLLGVFAYKGGFMVELDETRPGWSAVEEPNLMPWLIVAAASLLIGSAALVSMARGKRSRTTAHAAATAGI